MRPFENDVEAVTIAGLAIENGTDQITIHGDLEIKRDQQSLQHLDALMSLLGDVRDRLSSFGDLPDVGAADAADRSMVDVVANPFGDN